MPGFAGIDASDYPGRDLMGWLKANSNAVWCGYYLAPAPSRTNASWMGERAFLEAAGWGLAPTYVGQQISGPGRHNVTPAQGAIDGADAANLMAGEGFDAGAFVYLDLEDGAPYTSPRADYVSNWIAAVQAAGFQPGVYCAHSFAQDVHAAHPAARIWAYRVDTTATHPFPGTNFPDSPPAGCG